MFIFNGSAQYRSRFVQNLAYQPSPPQMYLLTIFYNFICYPKISIHFLSIWEILVLEPNHTKILYIINSCICNGHTYFQSLHMCRRINSSIIEKYIFSLTKFIQPTSIRYISQVSNAIESVGIFLFGIQVPQLRTNLIGS